MATIDFDGIIKRITSEFKEGNLPHDAVVEVAEIRQKLAYDYMKMFLQRVSLGFESEYKRQNPDPKYSYPFSGVFENSGYDFDIKDYGIGTPVYVYEITFGKDNRRESIKTKKGHQGKGVGNILFLFEVGYAANKSVFGTWESKSKGATVGDVWSKRKRQGLYAINRAIEEFNWLHEADGVRVEWIDEWQYGKIMWQ